jgi:hypothetical protein
MAAVMQESDIQDLVNMTRGDEGKGRLQNVAMNFTHYPIVGTMLGPDKLQVESGYRIERNIMTRLPDAAYMTGLYGTDQIVAEDLTSKIIVEFRQVATGYMFDVNEIAPNQGAARIYDLMKSKRAGAEGAMIELLEQKAWAAPSSSTENEFLGIPYWIVKNATTGFTGGAPSGHTLVGNLNPDSVANWKNYSVAYTSVDKTDLFPKLRTAMRKCDFKEVLDIEGYNKMKKTYRLYLNEVTLVDFETVGEAQNENLGRDLAPYDGGILSKRGITGVAEFAGELTFRRRPLVYAPRLDSDADDPVYGIDHSRFYFHVCKACDMKETPAIRHPAKHNVYQVFKDLRGNYCCVDRRAQFVAFVN